MALFTISNSTSSLATIDDIAGSKTLQTAGKEIKDNYTVTASVPVYDNASIGVQQLLLNLNTSTLTVKIAGSTITGSGSYYVLKKGPLTLNSSGSGLIVNNVLYSANTDVVINDLSDTAMVFSYQPVGGYDFVNTYSSTNLNCFSRVEISSDIATYLSAMTVKIDSSEALSAGTYVVNCPCYVLVSNTSESDINYVFIWFGDNLVQLTIPAGSALAYYVPEKTYVRVGVDTYYGCVRINCETHV